jgi:hypothetical protein
LRDVALLIERRQGNAMRTSFEAFHDPARGALLRERLAHVVALGTVASAAQRSS